MTGRLVRTPIVDRNGKTTVVHRRPAAAVPPGKPLPRPSVQDTAQDWQDIYFRLSQETERMSLLRSLRTTVADALPQIAAVLRSPAQGDFANYFGCAVEAAEDTPYWADEFADVCYFSIMQDGVSAIDPVGVESVLWMVRRRRSAQAGIPLTRFYPLRNTDGEDHARSVIELSDRFSMLRDLMGESSKIHVWTKAEELVNDLYDRSLSGTLDEVIPAIAALSDTGFFSRRDGGEGSRVDSYPRLIRAVADAAAVSSLDERAVAELLKERRMYRTGELGELTTLLRGYGGASALSNGLL